MRALSEDGTTRLLRRMRKLDGEGRAVAERMWEEVEHLRWNAQWTKQDLDVARNRATEDAKENRRLRDRCERMFEMLTPDQRIELARQVSLL